MVIQRCCTHQSTSRRKAVVERAVKHLVRVVGDALVGLGGLHMGGTLSSSVPR